ncbi:MAG: putative toxin-antitoxin system toxin component, PIN family [Ottowia sp.]|nr:putative toxin-antitoxin system toxin component, PIN family [Ottowia sp.]
MSILAVIDTNVFVSSLLTCKADAATVLIVKKMLAGEVVPVYSRVIMAEYRSVLARPKFKFNPEETSHLLAAIEMFGVLVEPDDSAISLLDEKDIPFYAAALVTRASGSFLVTGNIRHFPSEPFVVTPRAFIDLFG